MVSYPPLLPWMMGAWGELPEGLPNDLIFDFRHSVNGETPQEFTGVFSVEITNTLDLAPKARLIISSLDQRRRNFFQGGDKWEIYIGKGGTPPNPTFIGRQSPLIDPIYNDTTVVLNIYGYASRMEELRPSIDINKYTGWDVMTAVKDNFSNVSELNVDAVYGTNPRINVKEKSFATEVRSRASINKTLMQQAINTTDLEYPVPYHWREIPINGNPSIQQITGINKQAPSFQNADVLTADEDFFFLPRDWRTTGFNTAWYTDTSGDLREFHFDRGFSGKVYSDKVYDSYEEARQAIAISRGTPTFEINLKSTFLHLYPGDIVQIEGTNAVTDGYWQIAETKHKFDLNSVQVQIRLSETPPLI